MAKEKKTDTPLLSPQLVARISGFVQAAGLIFRNTERQYWFSARDARQAGEDCYARLCAVFELCEELAIKVIDETLYANDSMLELKDALMEEFVRRMNALELKRFSLLKEISKSEFAQLLELLTLPPDEFRSRGDPSATVASAGLEHVAVRHVVLREVDENALVIPGGGAGGKGVENIESILAFLRGSVPQADGQTLKEVGDAATDAKKLAHLIMQAADVRQASVDVEGGETLAGVVVGRLRKAFDGLMKTPALKTQKGKKTVARTLVLLEEEIVDLMHDIAHVQGSDEAAVHDAITDMQDELKIDSIASDYVRKRKAIEDSEQRILKYMGGKDAAALEGSELRQRLVEGGLEIAGWEELVVKSGAPAAGNGGGFARPQDIEVIGRLAELLTRMEQLIEKKRSQNGAEAPQALRDTIAELDHAVEDVASNTQRRIDQLVEDFRGGAQPPGSARPSEPRDPTSHRRVLTLLAEIVQELCQPLSVITCSITMIASERVGKVDTSQQALLQLAAKSTERMKTLIDSLRQISGEPETLEPDADIQKWLYGAEGPIDHAPPAPDA